MRPLVRQERLGYYCTVNTTGWINGSRRLIAVSGFALAMVSASCQAPQGSAGFIDPVFAYAVPSARKHFSSLVRDVVVLPETGTSAALYASLGELSPRIVLLSPLLVTEVDAILSMDDTKIIGIFGEMPGKQEPRLYTAEFSALEAARYAGAAAAAESRKSRSGLMVGGLFAGASREDLQQASEAFATAYSESGGLGTPLLELVTEDFSQAVAQKLALLDIGLAYISAPPDLTERWIKEAFDPYAYIFALQAMPPDEPQTLADALVTWDIASTLRLLLAGIESRKNEHVAGVWKINRIESPYRNAKP